MQSGRILHTSFCAGQYLHHQNRTKINMFFQKAGLCSFCGISGQCFAAENFSGTSY
jgi:hypothetical protein